MRVIRPRLGGSFGIPQSFGRSDPLHTFYKKARCNIGSDANKLILCTGRKRSEFLFLWLAFQTSVFVEADYQQVLRFYSSLLV